MSKQCTNIPPISATAGGALCLQGCLLKLKTPRAGKPPPFNFIKFHIQQKPNEVETSRKVISQAWTYVSDDPTSRLLHTNLNKDERFQPNPGVYKITVTIFHILFQAC